MIYMYFVTLETILCLFCFLFLFSLLFIIIEFIYVLFFFLSLRCLDGLTWHSCVISQHRKLCRSSSKIFTTLFFPNVIIKGSIKVKNNRKAWEFFNTVVRKWRIINENEILLFNFLFFFFIFYTFVYFGCLQAKN